jgi:hypothetical protein
MAVLSSFVNRLQTGSAICQTPKGWPHQALELSASQVHWTSGRHLLGENVAEAWWPAVLSLASCCSADVAICL